VLYKHCHKLLLVLSTQPISTLALRIAVKALALARRELLRLLPLLYSGSLLVHLSLVCVYVVLDLTPCLQPFNAWAGSTSSTAFW
jgi:hypothetical protein